MQFKFEYKCMTSTSATTFLSSRKKTSKERKRKKITASIVLQYKVRFLLFFQWFIWRTRKKQSAHDLIFSIMKLLFRDDAIPLTNSIDEYEYALAEFLSIDDVRKRKSTHNNRQTFVLPISESKNLNWSSFIPIEHSILFQCMLIMIYFSLKLHHIRSCNDQSKCARKKNKSIGIRSSKISH